MCSPFFIVGPTAVGKSEIATAVAERCGGEIINADAFQLYAGMEILTAKPTHEQLGRVPHHLIGTVPLSTSYSVAQYRDDALQCLAAVKQRRRPAIVVGGSGMYIKALTHGLSPLPPAQPALRAELEALDLETLLLNLQKLDSVAANTIDAKNKRRLVRAVEVCIATGSRFSEYRDLWYSPTSTVAAKGVFLVRDRNELAARIDRRLEVMFARGLLDEVRSVASEAVGDTASRMIGWREMRAYCQGHMDLKTCVDRMATATRQYAKRQMTWFHGETVFQELPIGGDVDTGRAVDIICEGNNILRCTRS